jgi:tetratricopeptide (TPR) repeat protein
MGDSMKRAAVIQILTIVIFALGAAVMSGQTTPQNQPSPSAQGTAQQGTAQQAAPPAGKRPPQAKTQPEFDAYKAAVATTDPAALEKAADDFAAKFPDSELRVLLYKNVMRLYQNANNTDKTEAMGRKVLGFDADDPEALVIVAEVIAERTRDSDIDKDQRFGEATAMAQKATQTIETNVQVPAGTPQDKVDAYKAMMRSQAYSIIGTIDFKKENYPSAEQNLQKSLDAYPADPDKVVVLRLALTLDKEQKYPEALKVANRAVELTQDNTPIGTPARHERDRLQQLTGGAAPAQPTPPKN